MCICFLEDYLDKLISKNNPIHVCKACNHKRLMSPGDLIQGSEMSPAPVLADMMASPGYKVFTL